MNKIAVWQTAFYKLTHRFGDFLASATAWSAALGLYPFVWLDAKTGGSGGVLSEGVRWLRFLGFGASMEPLKHLAKFGLRHYLKRWAKGLLHTLVVGPLLSRNYREWYENEEQIPDWFLRIYRMTSWIPVERALARRMYPIGDE